MIEFNGWKNISYNLMDLDIFSPKLTCSERFAVSNVEIDPNLRIYGKRI